MGQKSETEDYAKLEDVGRARIAFRAFFLRPKQPKGAFSHKAWATRNQQTTHDSRPRASHSPSTTSSNRATHMNLSPQSRLCDNMDRCYRALQATHSTDAARREKLDAYERALEDFLRTLSPYGRSAGDRRPVTAS